MEIKRILPEVINEFKEENTQPIQQSYHQVIFMTHGGATFFNNGEITNVEGRAILLIAKETPYFFIPDQFCKGYIIEFSEEFVNRMSPKVCMQLYRERYIKIKSESTSMRLTSLMDMMSSAVESNLSNKHTFIGHLLSAFMTIIDPATCPIGLKPGTNGRHAEDFNRFIELLEKNYTSKHTVSFYATELKISSRKLSHICNEMTGKGTLQLIEERRIMEAKKLLLYSKLNAQQVAYELGFQDHSYFTKVFKKHVSTTPLKFRKTFEYEDF